MKVKSVKLKGNKGILKIEDTKQINLDNFLNPFLEMIRYQKSLIDNPLSNSVRYRSKSHKLK